MRPLAALTLSVGLSIPPLAYLTAQTERAGGAALETARVWDLPRAWSVSAGPALEWRPYFDGEASEAEPPTSLRNLDLNLGVERRWFERWRLGSSLRFRARYAFSDDAAREIRPWLYATRTGDIRYTRTAQRFRTELRLRSPKEEPLEATWRHRYRFGLERSLAGLVAEPGEWSVVASTELLLSTKSVLAKATSLGIRPYLGLARDSYEVGLEYRYERDLADPTREHVVLLVVELDLSGLTLPSQ